MIATDQLREVLTRALGPDQTGVDIIVIPEGAYFIQRTGRPWNEANLSQNDLLGIRDGARVYVVVDAPEGVRVVTAKLGQYFSPFHLGETRAPTTEERTTIESRCESLLSYLRAPAPAEGIAPSRFRSLLNKMPPRATGISVRCGGGDVSLSRQPGGVPEMRITLPQRQFRLVLAGDVVRHAVADAPKTYREHASVIAAHHWPEIEANVAALEAHFVQEEAVRRNAKVATTLGPWRALVDAAEKAFTLTPETAADLRGLAVDPAKYVAQHKASLERRNVDHVVPELHQIALIDALIDAGVADELDWRAEPEDAVAFSKKLRERWRIDFSFDPPEDEPIEQTLVRLAAALAPKNYALIQFHIQTDSYPVAAIRVVDVDRFVELAKKARVKVTRVATTAPATK